jgi:phenylpyruvate tautomerase PptA (4-oxalocrotonate tautomerase family)
MQKEISQLYGIHLEHFNIQIMEIAQQVEEHIELLEEIKTKIAQSTNKKNDVTNPVFKYQNPDAWITPISGRED